MPCESADAQQTRQRQLHVSDILQIRFGRGLITADELINLDLAGMELAVLSACNTGIGEVAGGEGVFGLQRGFHVAGCRTVLASLWSIDDDATAALMAEFYRLHWDDKKPVPPIEALRRAQLEIYHHPERIPTLAKSFRGNLKVVPSDIKEPRDPKQPATEAKRAKTHQWAAFTLSGLGR